MWSGVTRQCKSNVRTQEWEMQLDDLCVCVCLEPGRVSEVHRS